MKNSKDLTGQKFGKLLVIERAGQDKHHNCLWLCKCDCGNTHITRTHSLRCGAVVSCGCYRLQKATEANTKHNQSHTRLYASWQHMKARCLNPHHKHYSYYGGRGIKICDEWINDFSAFSEWALSNGYSDDLTLDRIDANGNYEPSNCRWASRKEQSNNTRHCHFYTIDGETHSIAEWCEIYGVPHERVRRRVVNEGWNIEKALTTPSLIGRNGSSPPLDASFFGNST